MVKPANPFQITLEDLFNCNVGMTVIGYVQWHSFDLSLIHDIYIYIYIVIHCVCMYVFMNIGCWLILKRFINMIIVKVSCNQKKKMMVFSGTTAWWPLYLIANIFDLTLNHTLRNHLYIFNLKYIIWTKFPY